MALKRDDSFLQFLTMGAVGCARVAADLNAHGHHIIELERYTTSNKIWSTKIKRLRLPDLLCVRCGVRFEVRAKSKLEIKVSDSPTVPGRQWDSGLNNDDLFAFVQVSWNGTEATASPRVDYFRVADLRATLAASRLGPPKSASEGAERDRTWPTSAASVGCSVGPVTATHITLIRDGVGRRTPRRNGFHMYVAAGDVLTAGRLIAGIVPRPAAIACAGNVWNPLGQTGHADPGMRYAAIKALAFHGNAAAAIAQLEATWSNDEEDVRIRLEALAGLARRAPQAWIAALGEFRAGLPADMAMETIFVLSEVPGAEAAQQLAAIMNDGPLPEELRAAAAWGLGIGGHRRPELLLDALGDPSDEVSLHSIVAMGHDAPEPCLDQLSDRIAQSDRMAAAAIQVLARHGVVGARVLLQRVGTFAAARANAWVLFGLGLAGRAAVEAAAGGNLQPNLRAALEPLWAGLTESWLVGDRASVLEFLNRQSVREAIVPPGD